MIRSSIVCLLLLAPLAFGERWKVQYFFDELKKTFYIEDLAFPTATHGIAVGAIIEEVPGGKSKPTALITSDGGEHWTMVALKDQPRSVFFLDDSQGWMVGDEAIWVTTDWGASWRKMCEQKKPDKKIGATPPGGLITRLWFLDTQHGFAAGLQKSVFETQDGGKTWTDVEAAMKPNANPAYSSYNQIYFENKKHGVIVGGSVPPRPDDPHLPTWMEPERAMKRRQVPTLTFLIETQDGGAKWNVNSAPLMGNLVDLKMIGATGLSIISFGESFDWPSEVYKMDLGANKSARVFREKNRRVVDSALFPGRAYLAAIEPPGKLNTLPIPGKVKMLTTLDFETFTEMDVDYKAVARSIVLAGPDADHQWAATDTGMILRLVP